MAGADRSRETPAAYAVAYGKIAKSLKRLGEKGLALKVCDKGIEKFSENGNLYIVKGELQIAIYNDDNTKTGYLKSALGNFEKALRLDPGNYLAKLLASQIYLKAGARKQARALLSNILKTSPGDERAGALMALVSQKEKTTAVTKEPAVPPDTAVVVKPAEVVANTSPDTAEEIPDPKEVTTWSLDEKVELGGDDVDDDEILVEMLSAKLSVFSRLEGLSGIVVVNRNGQPVKIVNKAGLDENVVPSLIFNLHKASLNGTRHFGMGELKRGTLVCPIGTVIIEDIPQFGVIGVVVDNDANMATVNKRIHRYLAEVAG